MIQICKSLTTSEWMSAESLEYIRECLEFCEDVTMVEDLRKLFPRESLIAATKRVSSAQRMRLREWVLELNQRAETNSVLQPLPLEVEFSRLSKSMSPLNSQNSDLPATEGNQPQFKIGDCVKSLRDGYDSAWGANGKIIDNLFNDFMVIWTCGDGRVFQRRESPDEIALVENFSPNKQTIKKN